MFTCKSIYKILGICLAFMASGCIKNDIPYPWIQENIVEISAVGETAGAEINAEELTVHLTLGEDVDIRNVSFSKFVVSENATVDPDLSSGTYDLSNVLKVTVSRYQDYEWLITADQPIERYLTIAGQVGQTVIDPVGHRIIVKVAQDKNLSRLELTSIKLGPAGITTMMPDLKPGNIDCSKPLSIEVTAFGQTETWTLYVEKSVALVTTSSVDAWAKVIWAYATAQEGLEQGFQYKKASSDTWIDVPKSQITSSGGSFSCCIKGLEPLTDYVVRAVAGDNFGDEISVTTEATEVLPDGDFDQWWLNKKVWCPWDEGGVRFWDTGNTGAATLGQSNVTPSDHLPPGVTGQSAMLATKFVGIAGIGKLAAGSIFTGSFKKVDGTNGILDFGRPWTARPTKLRGYLQYTTAPINYASSEFKHLKGRPDTCHIYIALTDWTAPYEIRTNPKNRHLFDKNSASVIAYGELSIGADTNGYIEFEIPIVYRSTSRKPSYIQITCAASKYGDFFTGGAGAVLYVDQLSLDYDL